MDAEFFPVSDSYLSLPGGRGGGKFYNVILSLNFAEGGGVWTPIDPLLDLRMIE